MNFMQNLGSTEWLLIIFILLMLFGKEKLLDWARGLGESGKEMRKVKEEFEHAIKDEPASTPIKVSRSKKKERGDK